MQYLNQHLFNTEEHFNTVEKKKSEDKKLIRKM